MAGNLQHLKLKQSDSWTSGSSCAAVDCTVSTTAISPCGSPSSLCDSTAALSPSTSALSLPLNAGQPAKMRMSVTCERSVCGVSELESEREHELPSEHVKSVNNTWTAASVPGTQRKRSRISTELRNELRRYKLNVRKMSPDFSVGSDNPQSIVERKKEKDVYASCSPRTTLQSTFVDDGRPPRPVGSATKYFSWSVPSSRDVQPNHLSGLSPTIGLSPTTRYRLGDQLEWSSLSHYTRTRTGGSGSNLIMSDGHKRRGQAPCSRQEASDVDSFSKPGHLLRCVLWHWHCCCPSLS